MPFPNFIGRRRFWTQERVLESLTLASREIKGPLPCCDAVYNRIKKGRLDWPTSHRILEYFGSMARAWLATGVRRGRVSLKNTDWTSEEDEYLLEKAGDITLKAIATHLGRSYSAVRARLNKNYRTSSRHNQGYFSAAELSKKFNCPYHRVRDALLEQRIVGKFDKIRNRWQVDLVDLTPEAEDILKAPKLHSYKNSATDLGNYYERHELRRTIVDGRVKVVAR